MIIKNAGINEESNPENRKSIFSQNRQFRIASVVILFLLAGAIRLYRLDAPGLLLDRDYTSAIFARSFYYENSSSVEMWRKEIATITRRNQPVLEPPVTEFLVSLIYRVVDSEQVQFARVLTNSFWLVGGIFFYKLAKKILTIDAAIFATAYYLFVPLGILLSRSFQPDSLMVMLFLISLFLIIRYYENSSNLLLLMAASITGLTSLCRPLVMFALLITFATLAVYQKGSLKIFLDKKLLIFYTISLLPFGLYYGYGILAAGFLRWKVETSFRPNLLLYSKFWLGWLDLVVLAIGLTALIAAILGIFMFQSGFSRALVFGLWAGYIVFGLVFTMHIHTHGYYNAQLIPIVAISFGPLVEVIVNRLRQTLDHWYWSLPVIFIIGLSVFSSFREVRSKLGYLNVEDIAAAREIGEIVNHSSKVVFLAPNYGIPLQYYGELTGAYWPRKITTNPVYQLPGERELGIEERLDLLAFSPDYFVITAFNEYDKHHVDLKEYLVHHCTLLTDEEKYLIYGLCI